MYTDWLGAAEAAAAAAQCRSVESVSVTGAASQQHALVVQVYSSALHQSPAIRPWTPMAPAAERYSMRQARPDDEAALSFVCLKTGDSGDDGTHLFLDDPGCLSRIYTTPYLRHSPESAFVLCDTELGAEGVEGYDPRLGGVVGYCLATADSADFYRYFATQELPTLREQFPLPTTPVAEWTNSQHIHAAYHSDAVFPETLGGLTAMPYVPSWVTDLFPAHLHIDILSHVQRGGWGSKMTLQQLQRLTGILY